MFFSKSRKLAAFKIQIMKICNENGYLLDTIIDWNTPFSIKTKNKKYNILLVNSYRFKNSGIRFISETKVLVWAKIFLLQGLFGRITFPLYKEKSLPVLNSSPDETNLFVVYPGCNICEIMSNEGKWSRWYAGIKVGNTFVLDADAFREELKNPGCFTGERKERHSAVVSAVGC